MALTAERVDALRARQASLAQNIAQLRSTPPVASDSKSKTAAWAQEVEQAERLHDQLAKLTSTATLALQPKDADGLVTLARIRKGERTEMRVALAEYEGKRRVDVRLWHAPGEDGWRPTRRGITASAETLPALIAALMVAEQALLRQQ